MIDQIRKDVRQFWLPLLLLLLYFLFFQLWLGEVCPLKLLTGLPCPGCGLTRACLLLLTGHPKAAMAMNATGPLWMALILYAGVDRYLVPLPKKAGFFLLALVGMTTIGYYIIRMSKTFPAPAPLDYFPNNLMHYMLKKA